MKCQSEFQALSCWWLRAAECGPDDAGRRTGHQIIACRYLIIAIRWKFSTNPEFFKEASRR